MATVEQGTLVDFTGRHVVRGRVTSTGVAISVDAKAEASAAVVSATSPSVKRARIGATGSTTGTGCFQGVINSLLVTAALTDPQAAYLAAGFKARGGIA